MGNSSFRFAWAAAAPQARPPVEDPPVPPVAVEVQSNAGSDANIDVTQPLSQPMTQPDPITQPAPATPPMNPTPGLWLDSSADPLPPPPPGGFASAPCQHHDLRYWAVYEVPGQTLAVGIYSGFNAEGERTHPTWKYITEHVRGGQYVGSGAQVRRFPNADLAKEFWRITYWTKGGRTGKYPNMPLIPPEVHLRCPICGQ